MTYIFVPFISVLQATKLFFKVILCFQETSF